MTPTVNAVLEGLDPALLNKVRDIIEKQWGKHIADLQALRIGQFYERLVQESGQVSYRPTNRYVLRAEFRYAREPRRVTFTIV
jgi:hypothetical protein